MDKHWRQRRKRNRWPEIDTKADGGNLTDTRRRRKKTWRRQEEQQRSREKGTG